MGCRFYSTILATYKVFKDVGYMKWIFPIILAVLGMFTIAISAPNLTIRIIAGVAGATACIIFMIICYIYRKDEYNGE